MTRHASHAAPALGALLAIASLAAGCGSDDGNYDSRYYARCAAPRTGTDPQTGKRYLDVQGSLADEKAWLHGWIDDLYLWYSEVPAVDAAKYTTAVDYFGALKTPATTASNKPKDQFHFTYATTDWVALSSSGIEAGYGITWALLARTKPRRLVVAFVQPGSPAAAQNVARGAEVLTIDGADLINGDDTATLNNGIAPSAVDQSHTFVIRDVGATDPRTVTLVAKATMSTPVPSAGALPAPNDKVGYLVFNDHIAPAEKGLVDAITKLRDAQITDLVLDLRYNGGGYLVIAAELAYMIAGPTATKDKFFEKEVFNDHYPTIDPFSGRQQSPAPFQPVAVGLSTTAGTALPTLGLSRVFVLTGSGTCSASEAVMNGLAGAGVQVIQIGSTTCGKPYGFVPADNCGTTYFAIQFQGVNNAGFGDFADGFVPGGALKGCAVADDFTHPLGDPAEARLAAALGYLKTGACPAPALRADADPLSHAEGVLLRSPVHEIAVRLPARP